MGTLESFDRLVDCLRKLPGVGRRSAERMATKLVRDPSGLLVDLASTLQTAGKELRSCERCGTITPADKQPCAFCSSSTRDGAVLCVVEGPEDIEPIERSGGFKGRYHSLMGKISPMRGDGPRDLRIKALLDRVAAEGVKEVILALSTDVEGDSTAAYLAELLQARQIKVTRLAFGLPAGSAIMYSDPVTLARAIRNRTENL
jgi:recombination protein RecR